MAQHIVSTVCSVSQCVMPAGRRGWCNAHYIRWQRYGHPLAGGLPRGQYRELISPDLLRCGIDGCMRPGPYVRRLCHLHYNRWRPHGVVGPVGFVYEPKANCAHPDGCPRVVWKRGYTYCEMHQCRLDRGEELEPVRAYTGADRRDWRIDTYGYRAIKIEGRSFREHRLIMEERLGRSLRPEETIHHRNGDRADNRPENLELWNNRHPFGQRVSEQLVWALEFIALYDPDALSRRGQKMAKSHQLILDLPWQT